MLSKMSVKSSHVVYQVSFFFGIPCRVNQGLSIDEEDTSENKGTDHSSQIAACLPQKALIS